MAEEFRIPGLNKVVPKWNELNKEMSESVDLLLKISQQGQKSTASFKMVNSIKGFQDFENTAKKSINGVSTAYKGLNQAQQAHVKSLQSQQKASLNLSIAERKEVVEIEKLRLKRAELVKIAKQQAREELGLASAYDKVVAKMNVAGKTVQNLNAKRFSGLKLSDREQAELKQSTAEFRKYQLAVLRADASIGRFQRNVGNYPKAFGSAVNAVRALSSAMGFAGGAFLFVQVMQKALQTVKDFDSGIKDVSKTTGLKDLGLKELGDDIIDLSEKLRVVGTKSLLEYATVAGQLGVKGKKDILGFAEALALLETASDISGQEGGADIARLLTIVDGGVQNVGDFADEIVKLGNNFAATEAEILKNSTAIAQNTGQYKLGRQQALAYGVATKAVGIESEITGSTIGKTLGIIEKAIRTGKNLNAVTELTGKSQEELRKQFKENAGSVFEDLIKSLNGIDEAGGSVNGALEELGITAVRDTRVIASLATGGYDVLSQALIDVSEASGSALEEFETASSKISKSWDVVTNAFDRFILSLESGDGVVSRFVTGSLNALGDAVDNVTDTFRMLNGEVDSKVVGAKFVKRIQGLIPNVFGLRDSLVATADSVIFLDENTQAYIDSINEQNQAFIDIYGSLAPLTLEQLKLNEATEDYLLLFQDNPTEDVSESVNDLRAQISELNKAIGDSIKTDVEGIRIKQNKIKELQKELDAILGVERATKKANETKRAQIELSEIGIKNASSETVEIWKLKTSLEAQVKELERVVSLYPKGSEEAKKYIEQIKNLKSALDGVVEIDVTGALSEIDEYFKNNDFTNPPEDTIANWKDTFTNIVNVASQAFGIMTSLSDASFAKQFSNLEKQKENSLNFAGESAEGRLEIERQYEARRKVIEQKQAEAKKKQAMFEIAINTATAVVQALPNVPLSIAVGVLGGIQLALVAGQEVPAFEHGVENFGGGLAVINDQKGSKYQEYVRTPDGKMTKPQGRNLLVDLPKGSDVLSATDSIKFDEDLRRLTSLNNIMFESDLVNSYNYPNIQPVNNNLTQEQFNLGISKLANTINSKEGYSITYDENGVEKYITKSRAKTKILNNTLKISGKNV